MRSTETVSLPSSHRLRWSLAARVATLALVPTVLALTLGGSWLRNEVHASLYAGMSRTLEEKSQRIAARLRLTPEGRVQDVVGSGDEFNAIFSGWYWQLQTVKSGVETVARSRSLWDQADLKQDSTARIAGGALYSATGPQRESLLAQSFPMTLAGSPQSLVLQVYGPGDALLASVARIDGILLLTGIGLLLLLGGLVGLQLHVGLAPLKRLTGVIALLRKGHASGGSAQHQIEQLVLGPDLAPLQNELAALVAQNAQVVQRARSHAADLNHALKKPLSLLMAQAGADAGVASSDVLEQTAALTRLIDRYQARSHSDAIQTAFSVGSSQAIDVFSCARQMLEMLRQLHVTQELEWQLETPQSINSPMLWRGERADLEEVLGNLLDNAGKWAASTVRMTLQDGKAGCLLVLVEDDGPGMTEEQMRVAGVRGQRFDEGITGTGLGLSITRQIAHSYGGELSLCKSQSLKGLKVKLQLDGLVI
jgi:signal transduction histidine kinase